MQTPPSSPIQLDRQNANDEPYVVNLRIPEHVSCDPGPWSITSNAGSDNEDLEDDEEETFQVDFFDLFFDSESVATLNLTALTQDTNYSFVSFRKKHTSFSKSDSNLV